MTDCRCYALPFGQQEFLSTFLGVDVTDGRFADVSIERCASCGQHWLHYAFEIEAFTASGRWYRVCISEVESQTVTASTAVEVMSRRDFHFCGGSYFKTNGLRCDRPLDARHL